MAAPSALELAALAPGKGAEAGAGEQNGLVPAKAAPPAPDAPPAPAPAKFTGLGKAELLEAAGSAPWARTRLVLLLLFWAGWAGMVGAAAAIVARAPRCRPLPHRPWWHLGGLYRAPGSARGPYLGGVEQQLEAVAALGLRGLVLPHPQTPPPGADPPKSLPPLDRISPDQRGRFEELLRLARARGLQLLLDVTPNPWGEGPAWLGPEVTGDPDFPGNVTRALRVWLERGVAGFFIDGIEELEPKVVAGWRNETERGKGPDGVERLLAGAVRSRPPGQLLELLNGSRWAGPAPGAGPERGAWPEKEAGLVLGPFLERLWPLPPGPGPAPRLLELLPHISPDIAWSVGSPERDLWVVSGPRAPQRLLLLWALPGTPLLSHSDELGLAQPQGDPQPTQVTSLSWEHFEGSNSSQPSALELCRRLGALRQRERSLALGEASPVEAMAARGEATAFLRSWDQSERFLVLINNVNRTLEPGLRDPRLPPRATLRLSTHRPLPPDPRLDLGGLRLLPYEGLLLSFAP